MTERIRTLSTQEEIIGKVREFFGILEEYKDKFDAALAEQSLNRILARHGHISAVRNEIRSRKKLIEEVCGNVVTAMIVQPQSPEPGDQSPQ